MKGILVKLEKIARRRAYYPLFTVLAARLLQCDPGLLFYRSAGGPGGSGTQRSDARGELRD